MEIRTLTEVNVGSIEFDQTDKGTSVCKFSVADNYQDRDNNDVTAWTNCKAYGYLADMLNNNDAKGRRVSISGEMNYWEYQGEQYSELRVSSVRFVDSKGKRRAGSGSNGRSRKRKKTNATDNEKFVPDDDLPF